MNAKFVPLQLNIKQKQKKFKVIQTSELTFWCTTLKRSNNQVNEKLLFVPRKVPEVSSNVRVFHTDKVSCTCGMEACCTLKEQFLDEVHRWRIMMYDPETKQRWCENSFFFIYCSMCFTALLDRIWYYPYRRPCLFYWRRPLNKKMVMNQNMKHAHYYFDKELMFFV